MEATDSENQENQEIKGTGLDQFLGFNDANGNVNAVDLSTH